MAIQVQRALDHIVHALRGLPSPEIGHLALVNLAGRALFSSRPWKFRENGVAFVKFRGQITLADATWNESALTLTHGAGSELANYEFVNGDAIRIEVPEANTDFFRGLFTIVSFNAATGAITLDRSIRKAGSSETTVSSSILETWSAALPSDMGEVLAVQSTESLINNWRWTSWEHLLQLRANHLQVGGWDYWGLLRFAPGSGTAEPQPVLDFWPTPTVDDATAMSIAYRREWRELTDDNDVVDMPQFMELLFFECCRAIALGFEEDQNATVPRRLAEVLTPANPSYEDALRYDGEQSRLLGPIRGGAIQRLPQRFERFLRTIVPAPQ